MRTRDAFHLIPRVLNYFVDADFTAALGIGKLITSISMTVFYILLFYIWKAEGLTTLLETELREGE